mgnify:CR=1 FL=1
MNLTVAQFRQLLQGATAVLVLLREYRQGDNHFICVQTRVVATQVTDFGVLDSSIIDSGMSFRSWSMPARCLVTLRMRAALQPSSGLELADIIVRLAVL